MSDENPPPHPRVMNGCVDATVFRCLLWILTLFAREEERPAASTTAFRHHDYAPLTVIKA